MDALKTTLAQYRKLFGAMSPSQRGTLLVVPLMTAGAFLFLALGGSSSSYTALQVDPNQISQAQTALVAAGLDDFHSEGQKIMVPSKQFHRYSAALLEGGSLGSGWAAEFQKQIEKQSVFTPKNQMKQFKEIALVQELTKVIKAVPDIDDASVMWTNPTTRNWRDRNNVGTATVSVRPSGGQEIPPRLVHALRATVANALGIPTEKVVIFDQISGTNYDTGSQGDLFSSRILSQIRDFSLMYEKNIRKQLGFIPGVTVAVDVELDNIRAGRQFRKVVDPKKVVAIASSESTSTQESTNQAARAEPGVAPNSPRAIDSRPGSSESQKSEESSSEIVNLPSVDTQITETLGGLPKSVQVAVGIPNDYFRGAAEKQVKETGLVRGQTEEENKTFDEAVQKAAAEFETTVPDNVKEMVLEAIGAGLENKTVTVKTFHGVEVTPLPDVPLTSTIGGWISQWGGAAGLALFALWALRLLSKSTPNSPNLDDSNTEEAEPTPARQRTKDESTTENEVDAEPTRRDELQGVVRDNPEMAAAVIGRWLQDASN